MHLRLVEHLLLGIYFTMLFSITVFSIELCTNAKYTPRGMPRKLLVTVIVLLAMYQTHSPVKSH